MNFFLCARSRSSSRTTFLRARKVTAGSRVFLTGRTASSSCSPPLVAGAATTTRIILVSGSTADGGSDESRKIFRGGFCYLKITSTPS